MNETIPLLGKKDAYSYGTARQISLIPGRPVGRDQAGRITEITTPKLNEKSFRFPSSLEDKNFSYGVNKALAGLKNPKVHDRLLARGGVDHVVEQVFKNQDNSVAGYGLQPHGNNSEQPYAVLLHNGNMTAIDDSAAKAMHAWSQPKIQVYSVPIEKHVPVETTTARLLDSMTPKKLDKMNVQELQGRLNNLKEQNWSFKFQADNRETEANKSLQLSLEKKIEDLEARIRAKQ